MTPNKSKVEYKMVTYPVVLRRFALRSKRLLSLVGSICLILVLAVLLLPACAQQAAPTTPGATTPAATTPGATKPAATTPAATTPAVTKPAPSPQATVYNWKMTTCGAKVTPWHYNNEDFAQRVKDMSNGRINITLYPLAVLFDAKDTVDNVQHKVVEMAMQFADYNVTKDPQFRLTCYIVGDPLNVGEYLLFQKAGAQAISAELYAKYGSHLLGKMLFSTENFLCKKPVTKAADLKGLKLRGSGPSEMLFKELGALPTYVSSAEAYTAIQLGTIEGGDVTGAKGNWDMGLHEVTSYIIEPCFYNTQGGAGADWIINEEVWKSLSPDLQSILVSAADSSGMNSWLSERKENLEYRQKMVDKGLKVCTIPPSEMEIIYKATYKVWNQLAAMDPTSDKMIKLLKQTCNFVGKPIIE